MVRPPLPRGDLEHVLAHTGDLWPEMRGQSIFITGGTGFFGMWLLETFVHANDVLDLGMNAVVLTRDLESFARRAPHLMGRADLKFIQGDIRNFAFPTGRFVYVIHAATEASAKLNEEAPHEMLDAILSGTRRVLDFCAQAGIKKLLFTSSGAVYGRQPTELTHIPESYSGAPDPLLPSSAYGEGKRVAEHLIAVHSRRFGYDAKIARCFAFVGPHLPLDSHFAIGNFIGDTMAGRPIKVAGDGTAVRSYLYAADLAIWLWTILFRGAPNRAYNVGSAAALPISTLAREVGSALGAMHGVDSTPVPTPGRTSTRYVPDVSRADQELQLQCRVPLATAIRKTAEWSGWKQPAP